MGFIKIGSVRMNDRQPWQVSVTQLTQPQKKKKKEHLGYFGVDPESATEAV